ncbi:hypothetical protein Hanom_Chr06g00485701 [Helianthus anomalus]
MCRRVPEQSTNWHIINRMCRSDPLPSVGKSPSQTCFEACHGAPFLPKSCLSRR